MARGNQREKAREKNLKEQANQASNQQMNTVSCSMLTYHRRRKTLYATEAWDSYRMELTLFRCQELSRRKPRRMLPPLCERSKLRVRSLFTSWSHSLKLITRKPTLKKRQRGGSDLLLRSSLCMTTFFDGQQRLLTERNCKDEEWLELVVSGVNKALLPRPH